MNELNMRLWPLAPCAIFIIAVLSLRLMVALRHCRDYNSKYSRLSELLDIERDMTQKVKASLSAERESARGNRLSRDGTAKQLEDCQERLRSVTVELCEKTKYAKNLAAEMKSKLLHLTNMLHDISVVTGAVSRSPELAGDAMVSLPQHRELNALRPLVIRNPGDYLDGEDGSSPQSFADAFIERVRANQGLKPLPVKGASGIDIPPYGHEL